MGAIQTRGTCWFYSILNGFILSEDGQKILYNRLTNFYKKLKPAERTYFDDEFNAPCPMKNLTKTKEIYFWKFIDQYLCFRSGPRAVSLKAGKSASILGGMSLQGSIARQNQGGKGAFPQIEIGKILDHVGFKGDYYFKYANDPPKFHAGRKPQFVVVMHDKYYPKNFMKQIPKGLLDDPKYELTCASLVIANTNANNREMHKSHAVAGFKCNGEGYIYDSNQRKIFKCNWWNLADFKKVANEEIAPIYPFFKNGQINVHQYAFAIFARKEFTKDIGVSCLMKYKTNIPRGYENLNFTDPNLGNKLNSTMYNFLKPVHRITLKRKWARTEHRKVMYINKSTFNSIFTGAKNRSNGYQKVFNLQNAGYKVKPENFEKFNKNLRAKFPDKKASPIRTLTFSNAVTRLTPFTTSTAAVRKHQYSLVWKGIPMAQRRVLMHWRNKGEWLANNAFAKHKSVAKPKPKSPSPSPHAKRAIQVKSNFEKYWKAMQPENRQMIRNYVGAYKSPNPLKPKSLSPVPVKPKSLSPVANVLTVAKRNVNALKTAKARKEYRLKRALNMTETNLKGLRLYIKRKDRHARLVRNSKKK
jgi:hypothetical protein